MRVLILLVLLLGCVTEPRLTDYDRVPLVIPFYYREWWQEMESCTGQTGDLEAITWYQLADTTARTFRAEGQDAAGMYLPAEHAILLAAPWRDTRAVVAHEMIHALRRRGGHPPIFAVCGV
jgi:hypothetical protein